MKLLDVNVLVAVFREEHRHHELARGWLSRVLTERMQIGLASPVVSGFVRVVTNPRVYPDATPLDLALTQMDDLMRHPSVVTVSPGPRHWELFSGVCRDVDARGSLVSDAVIAAIAIEQGATVVTLDRGFRRFPGVRWEAPG